MLEAFERSSSTSRTPACRFYTTRDAGLLHGRASISISPSSFWIAPNPSMERRAKAHASTPTNGLAFATAASHRYGPTIGELAHSQRRNHLSATCTDCDEELAPQLSFFDKHGKFVVPPVAEVAHHPPKAHPVPESRFCRSWRVGWAEQKRPLGMRRPWLNGKEVADAQCPPCAGRFAFQSAHLLIPVSGLYAGIARRSGSAHSPQRRSPAPGASASEMAAFLRSATQDFECEIVLSSANDERFATCRLSTRRQKHIVASWVGPTLPAFDVHPPQDFPLYKSDVWMGQYGRNRFS